MGISLGAVVCVVVVLYGLNKCYFHRSPGELWVQGVPLERSPWSGALLGQGYGLDGKSVLPGGAGVTAWFSSSREWKGPEQQVLQCCGESPRWRRGGG